LTQQIARTIGDGPATYGYADHHARHHHSYVLPAIEALLPDPQALSTVLDAGCGNGSLSAWLHRKGFRVRGIDVAEDGVAQAKLHHRGIHFDVRSIYEDLSDLHDGAGFDFIVTSEVIEHLFAPQRFVTNLFANLRPGGCLILTTPYHGYLKNLALSIANGWDRHFHSAREGGHIKFFSELSMTELLGEAGFVDLRFKNAGRVPWLWKSLVVRATKPGASS
jgi:2-polyprenyl-3-methyl-5-hydroxy-6-metoxy-1,4-benzoquinol methylase